MIIRIIICLILLIIGHSIVAPAQTYQEPEEQQAPKRSYHYIGIQANQLLRQLLSLGNAAPTVANPYTLTYAVNQRSSGFGFTTGLGYNYAQTNTGDGFSNTTSTSRDVAWRFGLESKKYLAKRWIASIGGDVVIEGSKTETKSEGSGTTTSITSKINRSGFGPRASLNFQINDKIVLGTEASFYFKWITQKQETQGTGMPPVPETKLKSNGFTLPAVVFLMVRL